MTVFNSHIRENQLSLIIYYLYFSTNTGSLTHTSVIVSSTGVQFCFGQNSFKANAIVALALA
jgi:hypothetical protein